ncbi:MAG: DUF342 domain-containing protein [Spirochaetales bacterium]|nr:DUF342 domain-containing protein [Spirochaetales bacterium]
MPPSAVRGRLSLSVDEAELAAVVTFHPDPDGAEWSAGAIARHLLDAGLAAGASKRAEELFKAFSRAGKEGITEWAARGVAPEATVPEYAEWAELPIPPELEPFMDDVVFSARAPELFRTRIEKERVEREVRKPAAFPFLKPKRELVVEERKREIREPVAVDTTVLRVAWAEAGDRLGAVSPAKPGKPGKTIHGKPVPIPPCDNMTVYAGEGARRDKNQFVATATGFVRIGDRWVDVVPFDRHRIALRRGEGGGACLLDFHPGSIRLPPPRAESVIEGALELGFERDHLIGEHEIERLLRTAIADAKAFSGRDISTDLDSEIRIDVAEDALRATLYLRKARGGGKPLELAAISAAIGAARLKGLQAERVKKDILDFYRGPETELADYALAEGRAPTRGGDREFTMSIALPAPARTKDVLERALSHPRLAELAPGLAERASGASFRSAFVEAGQELGSLTAATPGQAGVDVRGAVLPALPGMAPRLVAEKGIKLAKDALVAERTGLLLFESTGEGAQEELRFTLLPWREPGIEIEVDPDGMEARATLTEGEGFGAPLDAESVMKSLSAAGVKQGIDHVAISEAVAAARMEGSANGRVVARGTPPTASGSARITWLVRLATGKGVTIREDGRADFREQDRFTPVAEGQSVLEIERSTQKGVDGIDVFGARKPAPASRDEDSDWTWDDSFREDPVGDGKSRVVALKSGELRVDGKRLSISRTFTVKGDVGPASGNIRFSGLVQVSGAVLTGFQLHATGDVAVAGGVEAALVSSDGSVRVGEGIKGHRRGTLRAKKNIDISFAEQATLLAVEDVRIKSACLLCIVKTNGRVLLAGEKGALIGGRVKTRLGVEAQQLGSENGIKTEISFGQDYLVADQIEAEEQAIEKLKLAIVEADRRLKEPGLAGAALEEARRQKLSLMKMMEKRSLRAFDLRERFESHYPAEIRVRGPVFPGVILESHGRTFEVRQKRVKVAYSFDPELGRVTERQL